MRSQARSGLFDYSSHLPPCSPRHFFFSFFSENESVPTCPCCAPGDDDLTEELGEAMKNVGGHMTFRLRLPMLLEISDSCNRFPVFKYPVSYPHKDSFKTASMYILTVSQLKAPSTHLRHLVQSRLTPGAPGMGYQPAPQQSGCSSRTEPWPY